MKAIKFLRRAAVATFCLCVTFLALEGAIGVLNRTVRFEPQVLAQPAPQLSTIMPNWKYPAMSFTAASQSKTQTIGGVGSAVVGVSGSGLTTVTWQLTCSPDGGANFYAVPSSTGAYTSNVLTVVTGGTITTTSATMYWFNLTGCTQIKVATSGTFTATSVTVQVTASSNKGIL